MNTFKNIQSLVLCIFIISFRGNAQEKFPLKGVVSDNQNIHISGAEIFLKNNPEWGVITNENGFFEINLPLEMKADTIVVVAAGYDSKYIPIRGNNFKIVLEKEIKTIDEVILELKKNISTEFSTQNISQLEVYTNPNAQADILNGVNSTTVSTNTEETATPILRGSNVGNRVFLNNVPLYNIIKGSELNNIGAFSIFNTAIINNLDVYPSTPPITLPNVSGGAIVINTQNSNKKTNNISITPVGGGSVFGRNFQKKNIYGQIFSNYTNLSLLKNMNGKSLENINQYLNYDIGSNFNIRLNDNIRVNFFSQITKEIGNYKTNIFAYKDNFENETLRWYNVLNYDMIFGKNKLSFNMGYSYSEQESSFGNMFLQGEEQYIYTSVDFKRKILDKLYGQAGMSYENIAINNHGFSSVVYYSYRKDIPSVLTNNTINLIYYSSYFYLKYRLNKNILLGGGIRNINYDNQNNTSIPMGYQGSISFLSNKKNHKILLSHGRYISYNFSNRNTHIIEPIRAMQYTLEYNFNSRIVDIQTSIFYKNEKINDYIYEGDYFYNKKKLYGGEIALSKNLGKNIKAQVSNTFLKPIIYNNNNKYKSYDNIDYFIKANVNILFKKNIQFNVSYITRPGTLYTPIVSSVYEPIYNIYKPIYSNINSSRYKDYHLANLSISKNIKFHKASSILFVGINNFLNIKNEKSYVYTTEDYSTKQNMLFSQRTFFFGMTLNW
ncbi:carboxypeptidase-like regulatory domain-containing protein [Riemerella anatipestifer]